MSPHHHQSHIHPTSSSSPFHSSRHSSHRSHPPSSSRDQKQKNKSKNLFATLSMMGLAIGATLLVEGGPWKSRAAAAATVVGLETALESGGFFDGKERESRENGDARMRRKRGEREREEERRGGRYVDRDDWERAKERNGGGGGEWRNIDEWRRSVREETANRRVYVVEEDEDEDDYEYDRRRSGARAKTSRRGYEGASRRVYDEDEDEDYDRQWSGTRTRAPRGRDERAGYESTSRRRRHGPANANERFDAKYEIEEV